MTHYLLDTQIFLWNISGKLGHNVLDVLNDCANRLYLSRISLMEIAIKSRDGKLKLLKEYETLFGSISNMGVKLLDIDDQHLITLSQLKYPKRDTDGFDHKDPFDHLIISQAIADGLCLISSDENMVHYLMQGLNLLKVSEKKGIADLQK
jgi:PIN domain nuclease of toxin-antitoxin system